MEALRQATARFGTPGAVAREMYRTYSQGGWCQALLLLSPALLRRGLRRDQPR